ncbi:MFS transporter [Pseudomonas sp. NA-150]|uniref:MFS transporter n=1 Tax=Pseudomonas sp. NA-150 TaxID=3367525 RepID=UPI0037C7E436
MNTSSPRAPGQMQAWLLLIASCLPVLGAVLLAPVLPAMQAHFADVPHAAELVPVALTLPALLVGLLGGVAGMLIDRYGRKRLLLGAMLVYTFFGTLPLWFDSLPMILFSRAGIGLAEAVVMIGCTTLIGDYFHAERRDKLLALQTVVTSFSATLFIVAGGAMGEFGWRAPFVLYAAGIVFLPLFYWLTWEPQREQPAVMHISPMHRLPWAELARVYPLVLCAGLALFVVPVQAGYLLNLIGVDSPAQIGVTMGLNQLGVLLGALSFRWFARRSPARLLLCAFSLAGLAVLLMSLAQSHALIGIAVAMAGIGCGLMIPTLLRWTLSLVGFELRGRATGGFMACFFGGEFVSPLLVVVLMANGASLRSALAVVGVGLLLVALTCLLLGRRKALAGSVASV